MAKSRRGAIPKAVSLASEYAKRRAQRNEYHPRTFDRTVEGVPDSRTVVVDDPLEKHAKLRMTASLRDDPLGLYHHKKQIDDAQYYAGRHLQGLYWTAQIGGAKAIDFTREAVDGGGSVQAMRDSQLDAVTEITKLERALGTEGAAIVRQVLACCMSIEEIATQRGFTAQRAKDYLGRRFRECLETLAQEIGLASKISTRSGVDA